MCSAYHMILMCDEATGVMNIVGYSQVICSEYCRILTSDDI